MCCDEPAEEDAEVLVGVGDRDARPGAFGNVGGEVEGAGHHDLRLVLVDPEARGAAEEIDEAHDRPQRRVIGGSDGEVVSAGEGGGLLDGGDAAEQYIIADDEEEGREGAPLLHTTHDANPDGLGPSEARLDPHLMEQALDEQLQPRGEASPLERLDDEVVVDGVEGLGGVHEEDEVVVPLLVLHCVVEGLVELLDVVLEDALGDEALLGRWRES